MKKLFGFVGIALAGILILSSCKSSKDLTVVRADDVSDAYKAKYNINFDTDNEDEAIRLYNKDRSAKTTSYYDVYIAKDYKASLLSYSVSLSQMIEDTDNLEKKIEQKKFKNVHAYSLYFNNDLLYSDEASAFIKEIYNSSYGINSTHKNDNKEIEKNYDFGFEIDKKAEWSRTFNTTYASYAYLDGKKDITFTFIYLPLNIKRVYKGNEIVNKYVFLPIAEYALYDGKQIVKPATKTSKYDLAEFDLEIPSVEFEFDEDSNLLKMN